MNLLISDIVTAFDEFTIGSKVVDPKGFVEAAKKAVAEHDFTKDRIPGQGFVPCPAAIPFVSAGDALKTTNPDDYIPALHRGQVGLYLKRRLAGETQFCALVVYTLDAYLKDPDVTSQESERLMHEVMEGHFGGSDWKKTEASSYVLVAILASSGPEAPLSPYRFVHNLAGGNREALVWTADEIRAKAKDILAHANSYTAVAG